LERHADGRLAHALRAGLRERHDAVGRPRPHLVVEQVSRAPMDEPDGAVEFLYAQRLWALARDAPYAVSLEHEEAIARRHHPQHRLAPCTDVLKVEARHRFGL
jgi:hypothetical protein